MNNLMNMMIAQLKSRNPQIAQEYEKLRASNGNPEELLKNVTGNYTPEQIKGFTEFAKGFGISEEQLKSYGISTK